MNCQVHGRIVPDSLNACSSAMSGMRAINPKEGAPTMNMRPAPLLSHQDDKNGIVRAKKLTA